jgi:hypothetical protein
MSSHRTKYFRTQATGIVRGVELHVIDGDAALAKLDCKMPHRGQHQHNFLFVVQNVSAFVPDFHHEHNIVLRIEVFESGQLQRQLITQDDPKTPHGADTPFFAAATRVLPAQRREQYLTFSQSRAHFFRQTNGR